MALVIRNDRGILGGNIQLPASKSISNRLLMIRAIAGEYFPILRISSSSDTVRLQTLIESNELELDVRDAGTTFRFLTALLASGDREHILTGNDRMKQRPIRFLVEALRTLGADIQYLEREGYAPLHIRGKKLNGGEIEIDGSVSSQFISALMLIAPTLKGGLHIRITGHMVSVPYILMTMRIMEKFGVQVTRNDQDFIIPESSYEVRPIEVEPDWSAASYWYEAVALSREAEIFFPDLVFPSWQGDSVLPLLMKTFGVETSIRSNGVNIRKNPGKKLHRKFVYNFREHPDLFPALAGTCAGLRMESEFSGLDTLRIKESDRVLVLREELEKLGSRWQLNAEMKTAQQDNPFGELSNSFIPEQSIPRFFSHQDHRIAMSLAPLCLRFGPVIIEEEHVVGKSYPGYWDDLLQSGFNLERERGLR